MVNEVDEVAFVLWTAHTGNASWHDWQTADQDPYRRMAEAAINRLDVLRS